MCTHSLKLSSISYIVLNFYYIGEFIMKNELIIDCYFEHDGETIGARVNDNSSVRTVRGVEKMRGYFDFYNSNGYCGTEAFYEDFDDMAPVRPHIAKKYYIDMIERK